MVLRSRELGTLFLVFAAANGCSRGSPDATPEGAVRQWLDAMEASEDDPKATATAYALLGPTARANLQERARRTTQLQGRRVDPVEMIAPGRFALVFRPKTFKASVVGDRATVEAVGDDPRMEHASVSCVRETGGWRVEPELPELSPLLKGTAR